ncbi:hypothetical protein QQS21_008010 [Conoideocrella luteorostrata]|uniref:Uncharacterized protein n=1 Tax=Conoideocrella luteorostrata TaxID=1105319 RepID=A0AAJ0CMF5_9HYPO|nr:hypothetical protein QQS21_008010 [Conoideocrella luteorostrata]
MSQKANSGTQRATEVTEAMLAVPGYADDSMFFTIRYGHKAKETLRKCDFDQFIETVNKMTELWAKSGSGGSIVGQSAEERYAKMAGLKAQALDIIKDFPDLVRDFDRFQSSSRAAISAANGGNI